MVIENIYAGNGRPLFQEEECIECDASGGDVVIINIFPSYSPNVQVFDIKVLSNNNNNVSHY